MLLASENGLHVDELASGRRNSNAVWSLYLKVKTILREAGFVMHKWRTNDANLKKLILESETENGDEEKVKTYADTMLGDAKQKMTRYLVLVGTNKLIHLRSPLKK